MKDEQVKSGKRAQYAFEDKIKGKSNLNFIDVEIVDSPDDDRDF